MAARDLVYKFDGVSVGDLRVKGEARVEYSRDGGWDVALAIVDEAVDAEGDAVPYAERAHEDKVQYPLLAAIAEQCRDAIQSAVDEAIYRRDG